MQIAQVQVGNILYPLVEGQPLPVATGDTLKVFFGFNYKLPETTDVEIWASLYRYTTILGITYLDRASDAQTKGTITLEKSLEWKEFNGAIDILIPQVSSELWGLVKKGIDVGLWGLIVELPDYNIDDKIDDCIEATTAPGIMGTLMSIMPLIMIMMVFMMLTPMMKGITGDEETT